MRQLSGRILLAILCALLAGCATTALEMAPEQPDRPWTPATNAVGEIMPDAKPSPEDLNKTTHVLPANSTLADLPTPIELDRRRTYSLAELIDVAQSNNPLTRTAWNNAREVALAAGIAESAFLPRIAASAIGGWQFSQSQNNGPAGTDGDKRDRARHDLHSVVPMASVRLWTAGGDCRSGEASLRHFEYWFHCGASATDLQREFSVLRKCRGSRARRCRSSIVQQRGCGPGSRRGPNEKGDRHNSRGGSSSSSHGASSIGHDPSPQGPRRTLTLALISAMGISPLTQIKVADVSDRKLSPTLAGSAEKILSEALARRPDILAAYAAQKASMANVAAAEADFLPKLFISGTGSYNSGTLNVTAIPSVGNQASIANLSGNRFGSTVFAGVSLPLYDGGTREAILQQAQAKADSAGLALARTRDEAIRQIVLANNALRTSLSAYSAATSLSAAAKTTFDAALAAYRNGVGSITDVTMAETQLLQAKNTATEAYSTALSAAATLALATGSLGAPPQ